MSKKKPIDKQQLRERRNRLLDDAAAARLSLTEGVREMRAIAGMTQDEFARHRGVSARVIKAVELGKGNPTVATLNRIGEFFGLEVAFVPARHLRIDMVTEMPAGDAKDVNAMLQAWGMSEAKAGMPDAMTTKMHALIERIDMLDHKLAGIDRLNRHLDMFETPRRGDGQAADKNDGATGDAQAVPAKRDRKKRAS